MSTQITKTLTVTIDATFEQVARDLANPASHPEWAKEFFSGPAMPAEKGAVWVNIPSMGGQTLFKVEADVEKGIVDLYFAPNGKDFGAPLPVRLLRNGSGVDVLFTLSKNPETPATVWQQGLDSMQRELMMLKKRHEASS